MAGRPLTGMALADDLDGSLGGPRSNRVGGPRGWEGGGGPPGYNRDANRISFSATYTIL
jgi:hypothetical protein